MKTLIADTTGMIGSGVARHAMIRKVLLTCGILSSLLYVAAIIFGAMVWEGYNSVTQPVSELGAIDAPSQPLMITLGTIYSVLVIAFGLGVLSSADGKRTLRVVAGLLVGYGAACLAARFTPMHQRGVDWTLTDTLHMISAGVDICFILLIIVFGAFAFGKWFRLYSIATILVGIMSGTLFALDAARFGLWERINISSFLLWIVVFAVVLLSSQKGQEAVPEATPEFARTSSANR